ncbi:MAG: hypothetical protein EBY22_12465, partial [Gammaproteobacteria bacterium]|nr:hypothetical protein [Gammaproteobacteria bacterium]
MMVAATVVPFAMGIVYLLIRDFASKRLEDVARDLMPGVLKTAPYFKIELVGYTIFTAAAATAVILLYLAPVLKNKYRVSVWPVAFAYGSMIAACALAVLSDSAFAKACAVAMGGMIIFAFFAKSMRGSRMLTLMVAAWRLTRHRLEQQPQNLIRGVKPGIFVYTISFSTVLYASILLFSAWWPVQIPPEYYEAPVVVETTHGPQIYTTSDLLKCTTSENNLDECHDLAVIKETIISQYNWEAETGRLLFHHSYVLVPIKAFLAYGLQSQIPFLYGFGNSLLSIIITGGDQSISAYLETIPFVVILSIFLICLSVAFCSSNAIVLPIAFLLGLAMYFKVEFTPAYLAASFNPSRYVGVALQFASIFVFARGRPSRLLILPGALALSLLWNTEAAIIGLVAQILILFSIQSKASLNQRIYILLCLIGILFAGKTLTFAPSEILQAINLGFFNVVVPSLNALDILKLYAYLSIGLALLGISSLLFTGHERDARLALIPSLAGIFVKYVFNPASPHLFAVLAFAVPFAFIYIPRRALYWRTRRGLFIVSSCILFCGVIAIQAGMKFGEEAKSFKTMATRNYVLQQWHELGESFDIPHPEEGILLRINSLKAHITPGASLLLLSPFDHLL